MNSVNKSKIFIIILFSAMGGMLYGYDIGIMNGALLFIKQDLSITPWQESFLAGSVLYGGAFAILLGGYLADKIGRKRTISVSGLIFIISVIMIYLSENYSILLFSRFIQGIAVGFISVTVPLYLTEVVPSSIRGLAVTCFQLLLTVGILLANGVGLFFASSADWRLMFLTALIPGMIVFFGSFLLLKSPRWLLMNKKDDEAKKLLNITLGEENAKKQIADIKIVINCDTNKGSFLNNIKSKHYLVPLILVFSIAILVQLSGINSILQYSASMLKESGLGSDYASILGGVAITLINFMVTLVAVLIADLVERKYVIGFGSFMVALSLIVTAILLQILPESYFKGVVLLVGLLYFIFFFAIGPGAYIWVIMSELLPTAVRSKGLSIALFLNSMASALLASVFATANHEFGQSFMLYVCGGFTLVYSFIIFKYVPKTNGRSLEEIEKSF